VFLQLRCNLINILQVNGLVIPRMGVYKALCVKGINMQTKVLQYQLENTVMELNALIDHDKLKFNQQKAVKKHMSISGRNGRVWITPSSVGYDVSLSGKSVEKQLYPTFKIIFGSLHHGYKQSGRQPFWRTDNFTLVKRLLRNIQKQVSKHANNTHKSLQLTNNTPIRSVLWPTEFKR